jgi:hypothetical protein
MPDETVLRPDLNLRTTFTPNTGADSDDIPLAESNRVRVHPRTATRHPMSAQESAEFDAADTSVNAIDTLTREERQFAREHAPAMQAALIKGILAKTEPSKFVLADDDDDIERVIAKGIGSLDDSLLQRLAPRAMSLMKDEHKAHRLVGARSLQAMREPMRITRLRPRPDSSAPERPRVVLRPRQEQDNRPVYKRVIAELRAIHCIRITTPRDNPDEIVLGTVLIGAGGNVAAGYAGDMGEFSNGDRYSYGELPLGQFSLASTDSYPKHMYILFKLVETDSEGKEVAAELTKNIGYLASTIVGALATPLVGSAVGLVITTLGAFFQGLVDEDEFPIVGKRLTLDDMYDLGGSVGPAERTGNIGGHGGTYRIGYRWLMGG